MILIAATDEGPTLSHSGIPARRPAAGAAPRLEIDQGKRDLNAQWFEDDLNRIRRDRVQAPKDPAQSRVRSGLDQVAVQVEYTFSREVALTR